MKISIITVAYNSAETIADTLRSVAVQSHTDFEHLLIDGNSTDSTVHVVEAHRHSNLILSSEPDDGIYDAMNKGLSRASGEVIGFLNSDDFYADATVLKRVATAFEEGSVDACFADLVYVTPDNTRVLRYWKSKPFSKRDFANGWCPAHPTFFIRRSAYDRLGGFDQSFKLAADVEFMMRYLERGAVKSVYIPHVFVRMRIGGVSNKNIKNIFQVNSEILRALKQNNIYFQPAQFFLCKLISRIKQFHAGWGMQRSNNY
jgi:glycosyltransferase involved in cell wall biosynthesis